MSVMMSRKHKPQPLLQHLPSETRVQNELGNLVRTGEGERRKTPGEKELSAVRRRGSNTARSRSCDDKVHMPPSEGSDSSDSGRMSRGDIAPTKFHNANSTTEAARVSSKDSFRISSSARTSKKPESSHLSRSKRLKVDNGNSSQKATTGSDQVLTERSSKRSRPSTRLASSKTYGSKERRESRTSEALSSEAFRSNLTGKSGFPDDPPPRDLEATDLLDSPRQHKNRSIRLPPGESLSPPRQPLRKNLNAGVHSDDDIGTEAALNERQQNQPQPGHASQRLHERYKKKQKAKQVVKNSSTTARATLLIPDEADIGDWKDSAAVQAPSCYSSDSSETAGSKSAAQTTKPSDELRSLCPWCGEVVDEGILRDYSRGRRMNVKMQSKFCQVHQQETALETWRLRNYPLINWQVLVGRFAIYHDFLLGIVNGQSSHFRDLLESKIVAGKSRFLKKDENLNPGYYGPRGFNIMCDYLVEEFGDLLKERAVHDRVIAGRGSAAYIQSVLVAELAVRLIMDDLDVSAQDAREIMEDSKALGELVHREL